MIAAQKASGPPPFSWLQFGEQPVLDEPFYAARPGFVGIAANVGAGGGKDLTGLGIGDPDVDVQDEIGHLLHPADNGDFSAGGARDLIGAALAVAQGRGAGDRLGGAFQIDGLVNPRSRQALLQQVADEGEPCGR